MLELSLEGLELDINVQMLNLLGVQGDDWTVARPAQRNVESCQIVSEARSVNDGKVDENKSRLETLDMIDVGNMQAFDILDLERRD